LGAVIFTIIAIDNDEGLWFIFTILCIAIAIASFVAKSKNLVKNSVSHSYGDEERNRPKCIQCHNPLPENMKWAAMVEMKNGTRLLFCCARCKTNYEIENGLNFQHLGSGVFREM